MASDSTLFNAVNNWSSTLTNAVTNTDTTITLDSVAGLPATGGVLTFTDNNEIVHYTSINGNDLTVERGYDGTTAASHSTGQKVEMRWIAAHHNVLKDEIVSHESASNPHNVTKEQVGLGNVTNDLQEKATNKEVANGYAGLNASLKVIKDPANATATPTASKIPIADSNGRLFGWVTQLLNAQTGTTYTFVLADAFKLVTFNNTATITVTVPLNSSVAFPVGTQIDCVQLGAGKVTFAPASGATINSKSGNLSTNGQYVGVTLFKTAADTWILVGDLQA